MSPPERRVLRYEVPVDDAWHRIEVVGDVARVGCRRAEVVEFWAVPGVQQHLTTDGTGRILNERFENVPTAPRAREFRVFGTGQPIEGGLYVGTTYEPGGGLVWHLFAREALQGAKP